MADIVCGFRVLCVSLLFVAVASAPITGPKEFDVRSYGARGDGKTDNTDAFAKAWKDACQWKGKSRVYVPFGTFYLRDITFIGPCQGPINFAVKGTLLSPSNPDVMKQDTWIVFRYVDNLTVSGGGILDGQGTKSWPLNDCHKNSKCRTLAMNIGFQFVKHSRVKRITSLNSKMGHFNLFAVENFNITEVTIKAPGDSPNTDGIKIGASNNLRISQTNIGTGDDCIAILGGSTDIEVSNVNCGPGHGISVGSLGKNKNEKDVRRLTVRDSIFNGTSDGIRIKTWESSQSEIVVSDFLYDNLQMIDVGYPINIDQKYCPHPPCAHEKSASHVQIQGVKFQNIWGTSAHKEAVKLQCSESFPCKNVELFNVTLIHNGRDGPSTAICSNVRGSVKGKIVPQTCVH